MPHLALAPIVVFLGIAINSPFGAYRATVRKLSWKWFLAIHLPIPFIFLLRVAFGFGYWFIPFSLAAAITGQILGAWLFKTWRTHRALLEAEAGDQRA